MLHAYAKDLLLESVTPCFNQAIALPDVPSTAPADDEGWNTLEGKTIRSKRRSEQTSNQKEAPNNNKTPTTKTSRRGKSTYQPKPTTTPTKNTWAEVVKSGGINVQIVLGNGHLQLITSRRRARRQRQGGAARKLKEGPSRLRDGEGEKGNKQPGSNTDGPLGGMGTLADLADEHEAEE
ncbi:hypothetical protein BZA77DRAFT_358718 [Pyronema omphalodes]|nr:hypothetical protein BZA77DRAFT_358718 [Pyronema omphalodes]